MDASKWFNFYSFDVMGELSLGKSFNMLGSDKEHLVMKTLHTFMSMLGIFAHVMWLFRIFTALPILSADTAKYQRWVRENVRKRMEVSRPSLLPMVKSAATCTRSF